MGEVQEFSQDELEKMANYTRMKYAAWARMIARDLNDNTRATPKFKKYSKDDINTYISDPYKYEEQLRDAVVYIYGASSHFRRIIQYFVGLTDWAYVVSPYNIDPTKANVKSVNNNYRKTLTALSAFNIKAQFPKILTVCFREDVFYGTIYGSADNIIIRQLPSNYCCIAVIEGGVPNVSFNFSYFDTYQNALQNYPPEFTTKYNLYRNNMTTMKWQELDSPNSFAIKCSDDIYDYAIPPLSGLLREVYDLEDYKSLRLTKEEIDNYAMLAMKIPIDDEGHSLLPFERAKEFWENLDDILPEEIGSVLTPMEIEKIGFERTHANDIDSVSDAEQNLFTAAGVSSLLFNNKEASSNALLLSIKADQAMTYGVVKNIETAINRYIQSQSFGKNFKISFLDTSRYNRDEAAKSYLQACQYGIPMVSYYCATQGLGQAELDSMNFLENDVLNIKNTFIPLKSSNTTSSDSIDGNGATPEGGAPQKDIGDLTDSGEVSREDEVENLSH